MAYYNNLFSLDGGPYVIGCRKCRRLKLFLDGFRNTSPIIIPSEISWNISNWAALSNLIVRARSVNDGRADCNVGDRATAAGPGNAWHHVIYGILRLITERALHTDYPPARKTNSYRSARRDPLSWLMSAGFTTHYPISRLPCGAMKTSVEAAGPRLAICNAADLQARSSLSVPYPR